MQTPVLSIVLKYSSSKGVQVNYEIYCQIRYDNTGLTILIYLHTLLLFIKLTAQFDWGVDNHSIDLLAIAMLKIQEIRRSFYQIVGFFTKFIKKIAS